MKTFSVSIHQGLKLKPGATQKLGKVLTATMRNIMAVTWATVAALALIALFVWVAGMGVQTYLGAGTWGMGFIFLALALDNDGKYTRYKAMTGVALLTLALLQSSLSPGFMIISGAVLAAWLAGAVFNRLTA